MTLYVLDNGQGYSANCIHFVTVDRQKWGEDVEALMLWKLRNDDYNDPETSVRTILTSDAFDIRSEDDCVRVEEFLAPDDFMDYPEGMPGGRIMRKPGAELLGKARAIILAQLWRALPSDSVNQKCRLEEFEERIGQGWFGE